MCVSNFQVAITECMCERQREVLKKVGEQEDIQPIISVQGYEVS